MKTWFKKVGVEELKCPTQSLDSNLTPLNKTGMNWSTDCTQDLITQPQSYVPKAKKKCYGQRESAINPDSAKLKIECNLNLHIFSCNPMHRVAQIMQHFTRRSLFLGSTIPSVFSVRRGTDLHVPKSWKSQLSQDHMAQIGCLTIKATFVRVVFSVI